MVPKQETILVIEMLVVKGFNTNFLSEKKKYYRNRYSRSIRTNTQDFVNWLQRIMKNFIPNLPEGHVYNTQALSLNEDNLKIIDKHIDAMTYLNYSPKQDNSLKDDELGVELSMLIIKDK